MRRTTESIGHGCLLSFSLFPLFVQYKPRLESVKDVDPSLVLANTAEERKVGRPEGKQDQHEAR